MKVIKFYWKTNKIEVIKQNLSKNWAEKLKLDYNQKSWKDGSFIYKAVPDSYLIN